MPPGTLPQTVAAATVAVLAGARSARQVAAATGIPSLNTVHYALVRARELGLVTWTDGRMGTLRPAAGVAASDVRRTAARP